jgi:hypothetical protein
MILWQSEIASMSLAIEETKNAIVNMEPDYENLQKVYRERSSAYDKQKKDLAGKLHGIQCISSFYRPYSAKFVSDVYSHWCMCFANACQS